MTDITNDIIMCILVFIISIISILAGVGGGGIYTSLLLLIYDFSITKTIPISVSLIFASSLVNILYFIINKGHKSLTNYPILIIIVPFLSCGSFVGVIMLKVMPNIITMITIILITLFSIYKSSNKLIQLRKQENNNQSNNNQPNIESDKQISSESNQYINICDIEMTSTLDNENNIDNTNNVNETTKINENTGDTYFMIFVYILLLLVIVICEGSFSIGRKYVKSCSPSYIYICVAQIIATIFIAMLCYLFIKKDKNYKIINNYDFNDNDIEINTNNYVQLAITSIIVSIISTYTGLGGGVIINPILLSLGLSPNTVIATSSIFIWLGSLSSMVNFIIDDSITWHYVIMLSICAILGTLCGLAGYNVIVNKFKKQSLLVWCLIIVAILTIVLLVINIVLKGNVSGFKFRSVCNN